jgi:hypothetical protein
MQAKATYGNGVHEPPKPRRGLFAALVAGCGSLVLVGVAIGLVFIAGALQPTRVVITLDSYSRDRGRAGEAAPLPVIPPPVSSQTPVPALITAVPTPTLLLPDRSQPDSVALEPTPTPTARLPRPDGPTTPAVWLIPDSELVNSPSASDFDIEQFIGRQPGVINGYRETVLRREMTSFEVVQFVARNTSVNPRLLLAMVEYKSGWLMTPSPSPDQMKFPMGISDDKRAGLTQQLMAAANALNTGYYGYKTRGLRNLTLPDQSKLAFDPDLNPGTIAVQYFLAQTATTLEGWRNDVAPQGFAATYRRLFGDPRKRTLYPLVPPDLTQPAFQFPFAQGEAWYFGAGPHGGWDRRGSAWGALDFSPPKLPDAILKAQGRCAVGTYFVRAVAAGLVVRARDGVVVLDLDMDGDERTGWTVLYMHVAKQNRVEVGKKLAAGAQIGQPSCEGYFLNAVNAHLHITRRYNGEWIATDCAKCLPGVAAPDFVMGGWTPRSSGEVSFGWLEAGPQAVGPNVGRIEMNTTITW